VIVESQQQNKRLLEFSFDFLAEKAIDNSHHID
jgi:hypothetical protein